MSWRGTLPATCWEAVEATRVILTEAETPSNAVFLATHSSVPVFQRDVVTNAQRITKTDEATLLDTVLKQPADQPILPILGGSGTGKSHLVRWLRAKLPETESRRTIFVPKHRMSLRGILELILEQSTSDQATDLRLRIKTAIEGIRDENEAKLRLRSSLALRLQIHGGHADTSPEELELRKYLAGPEGLPALLHDPVFRHQLLDAHGPISRLVREKLSGKGSEDKDDAFGFVADDLAISVDDVNRASAAAFAVASALNSEPVLCQLAAKMLNEQLDPSVSEVFGIGGNDLKDLLVEVRVEMNRQGLELLLLIEDFTIFQGIQGGLLDAITLIPTQDNDICPMRVVMAVTSGYFVTQMPDTVFTRVYKVFDLDDPDPRVSFNPADVAARYMNAIRLGSGRLDDVYDAGGEIPNACEQCPVNDACHSAFGAVDGYGLFPFNSNSLAKTVKSQLTENRLSVRDFLTRILRPVLLNHQKDIKDEEFPSTDFDLTFRAGAVGTLDSVEDEHRLATPGDIQLSKRRVTLVRYWGAEGTGPVNLSTTIHEAFAVPPLASLSSEPSPLDSPKPTPPSAERPGGRERPPTVVAPRPFEPPLVQAIDGWRAEGLLRQGDRNQLRQIVHAAVTARLALDDGLGGSPKWTKTGKQWDSTFDSQTSIVIGDQRVAHPIIRIEKDDNEGVRALRALAWVDSVAQWRSIENGEELQRLAEEKVTEWTALVATALVPHREDRNDPELAAAVDVLLMMSQALGLRDAFKDDALSRTRALFAPEPPRPEEDQRPILRVWQHRVCADPRGLTRLQVQERVLRLASFSQGTGDPLALDLPRLTQSLRGRTSESSPPQSTGLLEKTAISVRARLAALPEVKEEALRILPDLQNLGGELAEVHESLEALLAERARAGQLPTAVKPRELQLNAKKIRPSDQKRLMTVKDRLRDWDSISIDDQIRLLTGEWDEAASRVNVWLELAKGAILALESKLGNTIASAAQSEYESTRDALMSTLQDIVVVLSSGSDQETTT